MSPSSKDRNIDSRKKAYFRRNPVIIERQIGDTVFLVNPEDDAIFYLNPLSSGLWRLLADPISIGDAGRIVQQAFPDTSPDQIALDVAALIAQLKKRKLVFRLG